MSQPVIPVDNTERIVKREGRRVAIYVVVALVVIVVVGYLAGLLDLTLRSSVSSNVFLDNAREILAVIASTSPWIAFFIVLCSSWIFLANRLFVRWNRAFGHQDKGIIYEIVEDNNSAAALVLLVPMIIIALGLIYVALLNLPSNLPTIVTTR